MMITNTRMMRSTIFLFAMLSLAFIGCGGSGGDAPAPAPSLEVLPADFQFATVTDNNSVEPLTVTLRNGGNANLVVSDIVLSDTVNYSLDLTTGAGACGSATPTIASGDSCTVIVEFIPQSFDTFPADLTIASNDANTPYVMDLQGTKEDITEVNVKINQVEACPRPGLATVYVSVTDQGGFPVDGLDTDDFDILEAGVGKATTTAVSNDDTVTLSVALLMDYSGSITMEPDNVADMENAAISLCGSIGGRRRSGDH
jgi:hypothetical protein